LALGGTGTRDVKGERGDRTSVGAEEVSDVAAGKVPDFDDAVG
jgi:hypothetical protein